MYFTPTVLSTLSLPYIGLKEDRVDKIMENICIEHLLHLLQFAFYLPYHLNFLPPIVFKKLSANHAVIIFPQFDEGLARMLVCNSLTNDTIAYWSADN